MDSLCDFSLKFSILQRSIRPKGKMTPATALWLREEEEGGEK